MADARNMRIGLTVLSSRYPRTNMEISVEGDCIYVSHVSSKAPGEDMQFDMERYGFKWSDQHECWEFKT